MPMPIKTMQTLTAEYLFGKVTSDPCLGFHSFFHSGSGSGRKAQNYAGVDSSTLDLYPLL